MVTTGRFEKLGNVGLTRQLVQTFSCTPLFPDSYKTDPSATYLFTTQGSCPVFYCEFLWSGC